MANFHNELAQNLALISLQAAVPILDIYRQDFSSRSKSDGSPVTDADLAADVIIRDRLTARWPDIPIISEESFDGSAKQLDRFFLVDPLDGTKEFLNRTGKFTVNIALIENGRSTAGAVYAPIPASMYIGGEQAFEMNSIEPNRKFETSHFKVIKTRKSKSDKLIALTSVSHGDRDTEAFLEQLHPSEINRSGSSFKFCLLAKGQADIYPRFGPTMGWDIAAGQAILDAAGGTLRDEFGDAFRYDSAALTNGPFLAVGDPQLAEDLTEEFTRVARNRRLAESGIVGLKSF